ncbi:hypothetical protein [Curtobacterium sp. BH-2-1-1]|uniref:MmyB family transcriptional regulator n=1 Tax=Curtobacterium sp. BH-2-1-1 TaxID=1905847 RepID=UPI0021562EE5|nr:hypothetical protein [Curtobacterium sp. BH-2-1-1]
MQRIVRIQTGEAPAEAIDNAARVLPTLSSLLDQWTGTPAYIMDGNQDVLIVNPLARAMTAGALKPGVNLPLSVFSDGGRASLKNWPEVASRTAATLRYGSDPRDRRLQEIVGSLAVRDEQFRQLWSRHDAHPYLNGTVEQMVQGYGQVSLICQTLEVPGSRRFVLTAFHATAESDGANALANLRREVDATGLDGGSQPDDERKSRTLSDAAITPDVGSLGPITEHFRRERLVSR